MDESISGFACGSTEDESGGLFRYDLDASSGCLDPRGRTPVTGAM